MTTDQMIRPRLDYGVSGTPHETIKKYLVDPFLDEINSDEFATSTNEMKLIVGTTGIGKSWATFRYFIPELLRPDRHNLDLVIYTYPMTEIFEQEEADWVNAWVGGTVATNDLDRAKELLQDGMKVLLCITHQKMCVGRDGCSFQNWLEEKGITAAWCVDEPHTWMVSHKWNYQAVTGNSTPIYNAVLYKATERFSLRSPYLFGTTATPQAEQRQVIEVRGTLTFRRINEYPELEDVMPRCAWFSGENYYEIGENGTDAGLETRETFYRALNHHLDKSERFGKMAMTIKCERANGSYGWTRDADVVPMMQSFFEDYRPEYCNSDLLIGFMAQGGDKGMMNYDGSSRTYCTEDQVKRCLADPDHPCQFLLLIEKGKMGMNIPNLTTFFTFRKTDKRAWHGPIIECPLQEMGRLQRFWTGIPKKDFVKKYGYDMTEYIKQLPENELEAFFALNSYDIYVPDNAMWRNAIIELKRRLSPSTTRAKAWVEKIRS